MFQRYQRYFIDSFNRGLLVRGLVENRRDFWNSHYRFQLYFLSFIALLFSASRHLYTASGFLWGLLLLEGFSELREISPSSTEYTHRGRNIAWNISPIIYSHQPASVPRHSQPGWAASVAGRRPPAFSRGQPAELSSPKPAIARCMDCISR